MNSWNRRRSLGSEAYAVGEAGFGAKQVQHDRVLYGKVVESRDIALQFFRDTSETAAHDGCLVDGDIVRHRKAASTGWRSSFSRA